MTIELILSQTNADPMYLQIMKQIKNRIATGDWPAGFSLPSIRELAVASKVSVITVKRAYKELENEGVIVTQHGRGSFVADAGNVSRELLEAELKTHLQCALDTADLLGIELERLQQELAALKNNKSKEN